MRCTILLALTVTLFAPIGAPAQETRPADPPSTQPSGKQLTEKEKIDALIDHIAGLTGASFIRNDEAHEASEAADHLRRKLDFAGDRIQTARQFIDLIASASSTTGRPYRIRFRDGSEKDSGPYLREVLERIESGQSLEPNPAAPGFNHEGSDAKAIELADRVMNKLGGRRSWDETRFITWNFFGARTHIWDRATGDHRLMMSDRTTGEPIVVLSNLETKEGRAFIAGAPVNEPDRLKQLLDGAYSAWVNDSYWLLMPYKLKDSGVTLNYLGERATNEGNDAEVIQLTFAEVGLTPQNKYHVYIGKDSGLVEQWDFFRSASDDEPGFQIPWKNWQRHDRIMLSGDRGERQITNIAVFDALPREVFTSPAPVDLERFMKKPTMDDAKEIAAQALKHLEPLMGDWTGTLTGHAPDGSTQSYSINWRTTRVFDGRWLRFEFTSVEPVAPNRWIEWEGLFKASPETGEVETMWFTPRLRNAEGSFLDGRMIFFEQGSFDESGRVLTLIAQKQYGPDAPVMRVKSTFTIAEDGKSFTVVDEEEIEDGGWRTSGVFELKRK